MQGRAPGALAAFSLVAVLSVAGAGAHDCSEPGEWFRINLGVAGFNDCHLRAWAARYYFPRDHDPKWLAIDLALQGKVGEAMTFRPADVHIMQPDGSPTPLITQRIGGSTREFRVPVYDEKTSSRSTSKPASNGDRSVCSRPKVCVTASAPSRSSWIHTVSAVGSISQYSVTPCFA